MEGFYLESFFILSTERQIGMSIGPIPVSKIEERGIKAGLESDIYKAFVTIIRMMDTAYLEHLKNESEKSIRNSKGKKVKR